MIMEGSPAALSRPDPREVALNPNLFGGGTNVIELEPGPSETRLYAGYWLKNGSWLLVIRQEKADAFGVLRSAVYLIAIIMTLGGSGIIALAFYLTDRTVRLIE